LVTTSGPAAVDTRKVPSPSGDPMLRICRTPDIGQWIKIVVKHGEAKFVAFSSNGEVYQYTEKAS
jgi:hypothetical protein